MHKPPLQVAAAVIRREGRIFVARRARGRHMAGYWEFPGGKLESGETPEDCLRRELAEELAIEVEVGPLLGENLHDYGDKMVRLMAYEVFWLGGEMQLKDHDRLAWHFAEELAAIELAPADVPLLGFL